MDDDPEAATLAELEAAVQSSPGSVEAWLDLAAAYAEQGMPALAAEMVERACGLAPRSADLLVALGDLRNEAEDYFGAECAFARAVEVEPDSARALTALGGQLATFGRRDEAEKTLRAALRVDPCRVRAWQWPARPTGPQHPGPITPVSFHPKAYLFERRDGTSVAFVGSSNLNESALTTLIEWNYRVVDSADQEALKQVRNAFDELWLHPATTQLTRQWIRVLVSVSAYTALAFAFSYIAAVMLLMVAPERNRSSKSKTRFIAR